MPDANITRRPILVLALALLAGASLTGAARAGSLDVKAPAGWAVAGQAKDAVALKPPAGSAFSDAMVFDLPVLLSRKIDALKPMARAVFPPGSKVGEQTGRATTLDGNAALEIWGPATAGETALTQATFFVWKGTRMIPVSVLVKGGDAAAARKMARQIARGVTVTSKVTLFPIPDAPEGLVAPANWRPGPAEDPGMNARVLAPDPDVAGPPGSISYELLPEADDPTLDKVVGGLHKLAQASGAENVRTSGVETKTGGRPTLAFQQSLDDRLVLTGAIIRYPRAILRVTYFDRPDRARERKALFDVLVQRLAENEIKAPHAGPAPGEPQ
ncbi:MAG: hypothetical protein ACE5FC_01265 [Myxococcota bacterium]